ncbi:MAG: nucleotidyltransferase domain-containing protein [Anaerolineales bacterium]|jgi:predicted nucleotidyltransferase|nr:MAG: nucleotidyltransferase domain-containing protein [Anaerolineales bacterium]
MDREDGDVLKVVAHFLEQVEGSGIRLMSAYLYGSHAEGTARPDSDIDVALISEDFTGDWLEDHRKIVDALLCSDARIEPVRFRPEQFRDEHPLAWEIKSRGVKLQ